MADIEVSLKNTGKSFRIPESYFNEVNGDELAVRQYAVESGQLTFQEAHGREPEYKPHVSGPLEAGLIGAGRRLDKMGSNIKQIFSDAVGDETALAQEKMAEGQIDRLAEPVKDEFPKSSFVGEMAPSFAAPGRLGVQAVAGGIEGFLEGDDFSDRARNALLGAAFSVVGQKAGDKAGQALQARFNKLIELVSNSPGDQAARDALRQAGVDLTLSQRGSPIAKFFEDARTMITRRQPLGEKQLRQLNRSAAAAIGEDTSKLGKEVLNRAHSRIGGVFEDVARSVDNVTAGDEVMETLSAIEQRILKEGHDSPRIPKFFAMIHDELSEGMSGQRLLDLRSKVGKLSRQLWRKGDGLDAEIADDMLQVLDDALEAAAPRSTMSRLSEARAQWRFLRALRSGKVISPDDDINPASLSASMGRIYPGFDVGKYPRGAAGEVGRAVDAYRSVVKPPKTSGTAENLIRGLALPAAGAMIGGGPGSLLGALLAGGMTFAGGGTGGLIGGGTGRELARLLREQSESK